MPFALNQGVRIYWEEHGSGPPLLMIMGLSFTLEMWHRLVPELARRYRLIMFDNRGMGRSDVPRGRFSIEQMARDAVAVMDAANVGAAHVLGASMGGMIAQELALCFDHRVRSLMLGCTSHGGLISRWPDFRYVPRKVSFSDSDHSARERPIIDLLYAATTARELIEEDLQIRSTCRWTREGFLKQFGAILLWSSYRRLPRIRVPTLVVHGAQDRLIPPENGRVVARRIPGARFVLLPNAGHILTTDQTEQCLAAILDFLGQHAAD
ncbi:MAG TPA: alpha/beta fold hydrolase [Bryobacteraceae bacterium]|jgi:pimeloyl-ACP methyl ester carboxylesterase|nr:alpha/beta fold hydrolase [Bryobacteraceae bacterium]